VKADSPAVAVAVATWRRPLRLRWLLNALGEQTLELGRLEVLVAHDPACAATRKVLETHPLRRAGVLRTTEFPEHSVFPGAGRNAAWRAARAPLVLFTDDDCRPDARWAELMLTASRVSPEAMLQGATRPDPDETATLLGASWVRTMRVSPPTIWAPTCNMAYPRALLEHLDGFNEGLRVGEDTDLAQRAVGLGAPLVPVSEAIVHHAVQELWLPVMLADQAQWADLAYLAKHHPAVRQALWAGLWWKREHAALMAASVGALAARLDPRALLLTVPWLALSARHRGYGPRGLLRSGAELPGRAAIDTAEILAMVRGSLRHRTIVL